MTPAQAELKQYREFLENFLKSRSSEYFTNGGVEYAAILMAVMLENTQTEARIFCKGFRPDLITRQPYWNALQEYLNTGRSLKVLIESDNAFSKAPLQLLNNHAQTHNGQIDVRLLSHEDLSNIQTQTGGTCNFAIFDDDKFRFEYEPEDFKAFGSFNDRDQALRLKNIFDEAFDKSQHLIPA